MNLDIFKGRVTGKTSKIAESTSLPAKAYPPNNFGLSSFSPQYSQLSNEMSQFNPAGDLSGWAKENYLGMAAIGILTLAVPTGKKKDKKKDDK